MNHPTLGCVLCRCVCCRIPIPQTSDAADTSSLVRTPLMSDEVSGAWSCQPKADRTKPSFSLSREVVATMERYSPVVAEHCVLRRPVQQLSYDCVRISVVRRGKTRICSGHTEQVARAGDAAIFCPNEVCSLNPVEPTSVSTVYVDTDFLADLVFWQHADSLTDRFQVYEFLVSPTGFPARIISVRSILSQLELWLDEMVEHSAIELVDLRFFRMQSLLCNVLDALTDADTHATGRNRHHRLPGLPSLPRHRDFRPSRREAVSARELLVSEFAERWTLERLAERVHLSPRQLSRIFVCCYGKTPLAYLTMVRVEQMARLLRETDVSVVTAIHQTGWSSRSRGEAAFRAHVGVSPTKYRSLIRMNERASKQLTVPGSGHFVSEN